MLASKSIITQMADNARILMAARPFLRFCLHLVFCGTNFNLASYNNSSYHGFKSRANLSWHVTDDVLLYYTWSQGFRPGGFNRGSKFTQKDATGAYQYQTPTNYAPDTLTNNVTARPRNLPSRNSPRPSGFASSG